MGCTLSQMKTPESMENSKIDKMIHDAKREAMLDFKVLLLGAGESGKSTVLKQLKDVHRLHMDDNELQGYAANLHVNTVQSMQTLLENACTLGIEMTGPAKIPAHNVQSFVFEADRKRMPPSIAKDIAFLWQHESIQQVWERRSEFWYLDATPYYMENIERFAEEGFVPTKEDCIMTRVRTTGISVTEFQEGSLHFRVVDVGGQRNERKKWIHCFDDVKAILFIVSLSGYDQVMFEDPSMNRMKESMDLFAQICNNPTFSAIPIFLCFNKKDIFEQMIQTNDLRKCFPDYTGEQDVGTALNFIEQQFRAKLTNPAASVTTNFIAARYKKDVKYMWEELKNHLLQGHKRSITFALKNQRPRSKLVSPRG